VTKGDLIGQSARARRTRTFTSSYGSSSTRPTGGSGPTGTPSPWTRPACSTASRPTPWRSSRPRRRRP
jgi:hypothetical protein